MPSLLMGARNQGYQKLTNRVVGADGKLADLPDGADQQRRGSNSSQKASHLLVVPELTCTYILQLSCIKRVMNSLLPPRQ